jgi:hypothetical protein
MSKMISEQEKPLREQYLESLRRKEYEEAGLSAKESLLASKMKYATADAERELGLLETMIGWQGKASSNGVPQEIIDAFSTKQKEEAQLTAEQQYEDMAKYIDEVVDDFSVGKEPPKEKLGAKVNNWFKGAIKGLADEFNKQVQSRKPFWT